MDRPNGLHPCFVRPVTPAPDALGRWLGWQVYRLALGVLFEGRDPDAIIAEDLSGIRFFDRSRPETMLEDPTVPVAWDEVAYEIDERRGAVTLRAPDGTARTAVAYGRYGCVGLPPGETEPRVAPEPVPPRRGASTRAEQAWPLGCAIDRGGLAPHVDLGPVEAALAAVVGDGKGRAALVVHRGRLIAEAYAPGFDRDSRHSGWSMSKSLVGALVGRAIHEGWTALDAPAPVPLWRRDGDPRGAITVDDLLRMSSGLDCPIGMTPWAEGEHYHPFTGLPDVYAWATELPLRAAPGTRCAYQQSDPLTAAKVATDLAEQAGIRRVDAPWSLLFDPLGMDSVMLSADTSGNFILSGYSLATAQDWARFGQLLLDDGVWQGERLLPEGWLAYATTPAPADDEPVYGGAFMHLGDRFTFISGEQGRVPAGTSLAAGHYGQFTFAIPSHELVIVRMGHDPADTPMLDLVEAATAAVGPSPARAEGAG
jgi:CubicO group peptidase (beta-lactamase class C family)